MVKSNSYRDDEILVWKSETFRQSSSLKINRMKHTKARRWDPSLRFTLSLQSAFYTQSAFYPWSAVSSPQSAVCVLHWLLPNIYLICFTATLPQKRYTNCSYHDMQGVRKTLATSDPPSPDRWSNLPFISSSIHSWYFPPSETYISDKNSPKQKPLPRNHPLQKLSQRMEWL